MRQYRIGDLYTGKGYEVHASSPRVALNYVFGRNIDEFLHGGDHDNDQIMNLIVTDLGESILIQRVVREPDYWQFNGATWYGRPRTEEKRVLVADGIPEGWKQHRPRKDDPGVYRSTCGICGAKSPQEDSHKAHHNW
jgi:hypothetical protein|tara:strand:- start:794 stop:1204 length:411 start_codon:yes stop_codon:yes gene_type:complete